MHERPVADPFNQPLQVDLGLSKLSFGSRQLSVRSRTFLELPFCTLRCYEHADQYGDSAVLVIPPLSGHFPVLFRDLLIGLLQRHTVYLADWKNARHVSPDAGAFGFEQNIGYILRMISAIGPNLNVISICQSAVPALSAVSVISRSKTELSPRSLTLIGGAIDPLANPTRVVRLLRERKLEWFLANVVQPVPSGLLGQERLVYPAHIQLTGLLAYLTRHVQEGLELSKKLASDDGLDPRSFSFLRLFSTVMDLPAELFLENIEAVYHERRLLSGRLRYRGEAVMPDKIESTALMTIEGQEDDIAAPGQTYAAHRICSNLPDNLRRHFVIEEAGHFSLFHGDKFRAGVLPNIEAFISSVPSQGAI